MFFEQPRVMMFTLSAFNVFVFKLQMSRFLVDFVFLFKSLIIGVFLLKALGVKPHCSYYAQVAMARLYKRISN